MPNPFPSPAIHARHGDRHPLARVLAFTGHSIDDVVNSPVVKARVLGYYKLQGWVTRRAEAVDLDRWWSGRDTRPRRPA